jgi:hypothetical protein
MPSHPDRVRRNYMNQLYTLTVNRDGSAMYIATETEALIVDDRARGAYLHKGTPILDIFYRDCQHALSLHFSEAAAAKEVFGKVQEFLKAKLM